jgi:hypothetical protein
MVHRSTKMRCQNLNIEIRDSSIDLLNALVPLLLCDSHLDRLHHLPR